MADSFELPIGDDLKASAILSFLVHHDLDGIPAPLKENRAALVGDQPAFITLDITSRTLRIDVPDRQNASSWRLDPQNGEWY